METEIIDKLFLELSQVTKAETAKERDLKKAVCMLSAMVDSGESHSPASRAVVRSVLDA